MCRLRVSWQVAVCCLRCPPCFSRKAYLGKYTLLFWSNASRLEFDSKLAFSDYTVWCLFQAWHLDRDMILKHLSLENIWKVSSWTENWTSRYRLGVGPQCLVKQTHFQLYKFTRLSNKLSAHDTVCYYAASLIFLPSTRQNHVFSSFCVSKACNVLLILWYHRSCNVTKHGRRDWLFSVSICHTVWLSYSKLVNSQLTQYDKWLQHVFRDF